METSTASEASICGAVLGKYPPPVSNNPPTTVSPLIAFVTDISGECSAAETPFTTWAPTRQDKDSVVAKVLIPDPMLLKLNKPETPAVYIKDSLRAFLKATFLGSTTTFSISSSISLGVGGGGLGASGSGRRSPSLMSQQPRTASSASLRWKRPFSPMDSKNFETLLEKSSEAWAAADCTMSVPRIVTPFFVTNFSPGTVASQLPPLAAARSTMTLPRFMMSTMYCLMSFGAGLPGMSAVVMTMSHSPHCFLKSAISASRNSLDISLA
mmetsp:Transcript_32280/g.81917  ORF Transcript_32280/g.81917 Transcript_32280/m.81917 type:complete len:268 (+) Transcript_32280:504-1307(+)